MNIVFFGSDNFAICFLKHLTTSRHTVCAIVTTPDTKKGRGQQVTVAPLKNIANKHRIPCLQPPRLKDSTFITQLKEFAADLFIVVSYGKILPADILALPRKYCINVHPSLLPKYRGPSPVQGTLLNGETTTGFTVFKLNEHLDSGDIIYQHAVTIDNKINTTELFLLLEQEAISQFDSILDAIERDTATFAPQDNAQASYTSFLTKEDGHIQWNTSASVINNTVRALVPWPCAFTLYHGKRLKIYRAQAVTRTQPNSREKPGTVVEIDKQGWITLVTQDNLVRLYEVQMEGKKRMPAFEWAKGQHVKVGDSLG